MEDITVIDNFLDDIELKQAVSIISSKSWVFGHKATHNEISETPYWSASLLDEKFFSEYIKEIIEKRFLQKFEVRRLYMGGHTFGQDGTYHYDNLEEDAYTFCLYMTEIDEKAIELAGGHLYFKIPGKKYEICYEPRFNRGIMFPSRYLHKGMGFSRYIMSLRICVAWKLKKI